MCSLFITLIAGLGTASFPNADQAQKTPKEIYQSSIDSVVLVVSLDKNGAPLGMGPGFYFRDSIIATNEHVVSDADSLLVRRLGSDKSFRATRVRSFSKKLDIALIDVPEKGEPLLIGEKGRESIGEKVVAIGNPRGLEGSISAGIISGVRPFGEQVIYQITAPISPGSSGGPVFDSDGTVFGLATFTISDSQNINFAVPASALATLEGKRNGWEPEGQAAPVRRQDNAGIELVLFTKKPYKFEETLSLQNTTRYSIENLTTVVIYKTMAGKPIDFRVVRMRDRIPPGLAKLQTDESFDQDQNFGYHKDLKRSDIDFGYKPFDIEIRVLSYDIVASPAGDVIDELIK